MRAATAAAQPRIIDIPPLCIRAEVQAVDTASRTVSVVFSTGAPVERYDWLSGKRYLEKLSLEPSAIRLERLNSGAPLLDAHSAWSVADQFGVVQRGSAKTNGREATADIRFSKREAVEPIFQDVVDGVITSVSVGYRVYKFVEEQGKGNALPVRTAVDWEPYEISLVPMPADIGAKVRNGDTSETNACVIITRGESHMNEDRTPSEFVVEANPLDPGAPLTPRLTLSSEPVQPNDRDIGANSERERITGIIEACRAARLPMAFMDVLINEHVPLVEAQRRVFVELARREVDVPRVSAVQTVQVGDDPMVHMRRGIENAILHRVAPQLFPLEDIGRNYRGMTLLEVGKSFLNAAGVRTTALSKMEIAGLALGLNVRAGYHTTSDFALLLADVANKTLRRAYEEAPQTFSTIGRRVTLPDFKPVKRLQLGDAPQLLEVLEHGEYQRGTIGEGKEQFQLASYGRIFAITRKALVNDDTDAFARIPMLFGRAARNLESNLVWEQITSNPTMGDTVALFHASHANLAAVAAQISIATLGEARAAMRNQTGLDGTTLLNINPRYLLVPPALETVADQYVGTITPATAANANPFSGRLTVIAEPRLETVSNIAWYVAASPDQLDMIEFAYLEGEDGPMVESRIGFDVDGVEIKARHDFAAKVIDWRGFFRNDGAS